MLRRLPVAFDLSISERLDILRYSKGVECVSALSSTHEIVLDDVGFVELMAINVVFLHVAVILVFLEFL